MLTNLKIKDFKAIKNADVDLSVLNVIVGPNSAGKSSLLHTILLVAQAVEAESEGPLFPLNGKRIALGNFSHVLRAGSQDQTMGITITTAKHSTPENTTEWELEFVAPPVGHESSMMIQTSELRSSTDGVLISVRRDDSEERRAVWGASTPDPDGFEYSIEHHGDMLLTESETRLGIAGTRFVGGLPRDVIVIEDAVDLFARHWLFALADRMLAVSNARDTLEVAGSPRVVSLPRSEPTSTFAGEIDSFRASRMASDDQDDSATTTPSARVPYEVTAAELRTWVAADVQECLALGPPAGFAQLRFGDAIERRVPRPRAIAVDDLELTSSRALAQLVTEVVREVVSGDTYFYSEFVNRDLQVNAVSDSLLGAKIRHLSGLRVEPRVAHQHTGNPQETDLGRQGEAAIPTIHAQRDTWGVYPLPDSEPRSTTLLNALDAWANELGLADSFSTRDTRAGVELTLARANTEDQLDLTQVGVGLSQVLPVLLVCLLAKEGHVVLLEQPEIHLHPATQQRLADFFIACARSGRQIIVETHSDHLVNRLRRRVVEDTSDAVRDLVQLVFAEPTCDDNDEVHCTYTSQQLDAYGSVNSWPAGFFDEGVDEAEAILQSIVARKTAERGQSTL